MNKHKWLRDAVFYEIYPQSFCDSNGDGIGDLPGVITKLDYIQSLGCSAIWLNPCFESPFQDAGYDITDFYRVAPRYGTNDDLKRLIDEIHRRGMRIILDLVAGHTSIQHEWFKQSCRRERNRYSDYYIWTSSWKQSPAGFRIINGYAERPANFVTNYFYCQPALNYGFYPVEDPSWQKPIDHPEVLKVREQLRDIMRFYLDMGCDGFRVDMANSLIRGAKREEGLRVLWHDYRAWLDANYPDAILVSEWSHPEYSVNSGFDIDFLVQFGLPAYTSLFRQEEERLPKGCFAGNGKKSFFSSEGAGDAALFCEQLTDQLNKISDRGYLAIPTGNHDIGRIRCFRTLDDLKVVYTAIFTFPGVPFVYYGDEIGMEYQWDLPSKEGGYDRTGSRTPMLWDDTAKAGFSTADEEKFYLPLGEVGKRVSVASQDKNPNSLLNFTRKLIALRRGNPALGGEGKFKALFAPPNTYPLVFERELDGNKFVIAVNPSGKRAMATFGETDWSRAEKVLNFGEVTAQNSGDEVRLEMAGVSSAIYQIRAK